MASTNQKKSSVVGNTVVAQTAEPIAMEETGIVETVLSPLTQLTNLLIDIAESDGKPGHIRPLLEAVMPTEPAAMSVFMDQLQRFKLAAEAAHSHAQAEYASRTAR